MFAWYFVLAARVTLALPPVPEVVLKRQSRMGCILVVGSTT